MIKAYKVQLLPNNYQRTKMFQIANTCRFAYNWTIAREKENYEQGNKFINDYNLRKEFTKLKQEKGYEWLNEVSNDALKQSIKDACLAYSNFFKKLSNYPRFKKKNKSKPSFYCDTFKIEINSTHIKLEKISNSTRKNRLKLNWIKLAEKDRIPINKKYYNPRISFDGLNWWISIGVEEEINISNKNYSEGIGIDLGIKDLIICSNGNKYKNINKSKEIKRIERKKKILQKRISKKYILNKEGGSYCKTKNIKKEEIKLLKINRRLTNIRTNYIYNCINDIISQKPRFINIENLNVKEMIKNHKLAKSISEQKFNKIKNILSYKCLINDIKLNIIDRFYPSSKICSCCGSIKQNLKLNDRIYKCDNCNSILDRDINASINIKNYKF